jgi:hypothetical protein
VLQPGLGGEQRAELGDADDHDDHQWRGQAEFDRPDATSIEKQAQPPHCIRTEALPTMARLPGSPKARIAELSIGV